MKKQNFNGITLVALVITIIILLILAGISISSLKHTGILSNAKKATKNYQESQEREIIQTELYSSYIYKNTDNNPYPNIGEKLYDKNIENSSKWHIIVINDSKQIYGTGWIYLPKGSNISNITTQNSWLINTSNQDLTKLDDNSFTELSYSSTLGVTNGLIFNLDPSIIENATQDNINEKLGNNVELVNFDWNENSGISKNSFNMDGINDYIKVKYDNEEEKNTLAKNGLTFEFYGIYKGGTSYNEKNEVITPSHNYKGLFCYWNGIESKQAAARFGIIFNNRIIWNTGSAGTQAKSDYSQSGSPWNILYPETKEIKKDEEMYFTISLNCTGESYTHTLYANGNKIFEGNYNKLCWNNFVNVHLPSLKYFCIGRSSVSQEGWWHYSNLNVYSLKLYNRALNEQEVKENYNKTIAYHNILTTE